MLPNHRVSILYSLEFSSVEYIIIIINLLKDLNMNFIRENKMLFNADVSR